MTLLQIKIAMETFFQAGYTATAIHWAGVNFDTATATEWMFFEYKGSSVMDSGLDNATNQHEGYVKLVAMSDTAYRSTEIADLGLALFKGKKVSDMFARQADIVSQGYDKTLNKSYVEIDIYMSTN